MPTVLSTGLKETYKRHFAADTSPYMKGVVNMEVFKFLMRIGLGFLALLFGLKSVFEAGEMAGAAETILKVEKEDPEAYDRIFTED